MKKHLLILIFYLSFSHLLLSQTSKAFEITTQYGYVFPTNNFLNGTNTGSPINKVKSIGARYIIHTDGAKPWHQSYNYIDYGFGAIFNNYNEPKHLGNSFAIYSFLYTPLLKWNKLTLRNDLVIGLSYVQKHWSITNTENISTSTSLNCYIQEGILLNYKFTKHIQAGLGFNFSHISNGATKRPNKGINTFSSQLTLRYNFYDIEIKYFPEKPHFEKGYDFILSAFGGFYNDYIERYNYDLRDQRRYINRTFYAFGFTTTLYKNLSLKNNLGIGFNWGYDDLADNIFKNVNNEVISTVAPFPNRLNITSFISYEYNISKFSAFAELGYYLLRQTSPDSTPNFFQRVGFRYKIIDNAFATIAIRATNLSVAHYIEWGFGYRFKFFR